MSGQGLHVLARLHVVEREGQQGCREWILQVEARCRQGPAIRREGDPPIAGIADLVENGTDMKVSRDEYVVAILTGNVLKDPDYTVRYHVGELFEEFVTETTILQSSRPLAGNYANKPIRVAGERAAIIDAIERFRHLETTADRRASV